MRFKDFHGLTHIGAGVIFLAPNEKILLLQKNNKKWTFPGGHAELYEAPLETAMRECVEETGKVISRDQLVDHLSFIRKKDTKPVYSFIALSKKFKPRLSSEHRDYKWFAIEEITPSIFSGAFAPYWKEYYLPFILKHC
jgi:8-oxo-dGTP pyrophosphatase MutT (NUDIX family)